MLCVVCCFNRRNSVNFTLADPINHSMAIFHTTGDYIRWAVAALITDTALKMFSNDRMNRIFVNPIMVISHRWTTCSTRSTSITICSHEKYKLTGKIINLTRCAVEKHFSIAVELSTIANLRTDRQNLWVVAHHSVNTKVRKLRASDRRCGEAKETIAIVCQLCALLFH